MVALNNEVEKGDDGSFPRETATPKGGDRMDDPASNRSTSTRPLVDPNAFLPQQNEVTGATSQLPPIHRVKFSMSLLDEAGKKVHVFTSMPKEIQSVPKEPVDMSDKWTNILRSLHITSKDR